MNKKELTKKCSEQCDKAKAFAKTHKKEIAVAGGIAAIAAALGYALGRKQK